MGVYLKLMFTLFITFLVLIGGAWLLQKSPSQSKVVRAEIVQDEIRIIYTDGVQTFLTDNGKYKFDVSLSHDGRFIAYAEQGITLAKALHIHVVEASEELGLPRFRHVDLTKGNIVVQRLEWNNQKTILAYDYIAKDQHFHVAVIEFPSMKTLADPKGRFIKWEGNCVVTFEEQVCF